LATILRMLVHALAAAAFAWPLTRFGAVLAAAVGAAVGSGFGPWVGRTRLRTPLILVGALVGVGVALGLRQLIVGTGLLAPAMGPASALRFGDALLFGVGAAGVSVGLRALSARRRALAAIEAGVVAVALAQLVVAHRHGAINRPFAIADPIIAQGGDPTHAFLAIGAATTLVVVLLLLSERSLLRSILHLAIVAAILVLVVGTTEMLGPPGPPAGASGLGLRPDEQGQQRKRDEGEQRKKRGQQRNNEQLEFRNNYERSQSQAPVGVVVFRDDYSPPTDVYYFRQSAFSQYNGRRLVAATRGDVDRDIASHFPSSPMQIEAAPSPGPYRKSVEQTVGLLANHARPFGIPTPMKFEPASNPNTGRFKRTYRVESAALTGGYRSMVDAQVGGSEWSEAQRDHYTASPDDPRYAELAKRLVREELPEDRRDDPVAQAVAITRWLGEEGKYSLKSRHANAEDPTADFLFGDKKGYCVHFAHAATYLLRSLDIPSRVATGYAISESARRGGSALLLSGQNSHAWPEVYVQGYGWVVFDVNPETTLSPPPQPPDADLQRLLGELVRGNKPLPADSAPALPELARSARRLGMMAALVLALMLGGALLFLYTGKTWRRLAPMFTRPSGQARARYRAELDRLSELALRRRPGESREAFAARLRAISPSFVELTRTHVGSAFGSRRARTETDRLQGVARAVRSELRDAYPWWRRAVGVLNPWSWLRAR
jgi:transglutaminase-like putative cysteine protease